MIHLTQHRNKIAVEMISVEENPTPGTAGSLQLLIEEYKRLDEDWRFWVDGMRGKVLSKKFVQLDFNTKWLEEMLERHGELHCEFCGRPELKIYSWKEKPGKDVATTDHFLPKTIFPHLAFTKSNLRVACKKCNEKKGKKILPQNELKFAYPEHSIRVNEDMKRQVEKGKRLIREWEKTKFMHFRELVPTIDHTNFQTCTKVDFKGVESTPENVRETFANLKSFHIGTLRYQFKSKSGSEYFVTSEGDVYRMSDHWGAVSTCEWSRDGKGNFRMSEFINGDWEIGVANLRDFVIFRRKDDRKMDKVVNPEWEKKMTEFTKEFLPLKEKLESIIQSPTFKELSLEEKQFVGPAFGFFSKTLFTH